MKLNRIHSLRTFAWAPLVFTGLALAWLGGCAWAHPVKSNSMSSTKANSQAVANAWKYPATNKVDQMDVFHGVEVQDPYRWLEDLDSSNTRQWIEAQNKLTFGYLDALPSRAAIVDRLTELWNVERYGSPKQASGRYFFTYNDGLQEQSTLWYTQGLRGDKILLIDFNELSPDGSLAFRGFVPSPDGKYLAYGLSEKGSDWRQWKIMDVKSKRTLSDNIPRTKFTTPNWTNDSKGFYYQRVKAGEGNSYSNQVTHGAMYYHTVGLSPDDDNLIYHTPDEAKMFHWCFDTEDDQYTIAGTWSGAADGNLAHYRRKDNPNAEFQPLFTDNRYQYSILGNDGPLFYFYTNYEAPKGKICSLNLSTPEVEHWTTLIAERDETINSQSLLQNRFYLTYMKDAYNQVSIFDLQGKSKGEVALPGIGSVSGFDGRRDATETFFTYNSYTSPPTQFRYDLNTGRSDVFRRLNIDFDPSLYQSEQVFYTSKDGTRIPMFLIHKKGVRLDGNNPTILYGYGGFNISMKPRFSMSRLVWMEMGGVYAVACLRGGGEYGEEWHKAGTRTQKQNVFDDFIAAAEWMIDKGYTRPEKLAIAGGSNGGLLVGACITQRPDLYGAALPAVGVLDMLRYHLFTIGYAWVTDYGDVKIPEEFHALYAYSPVHNTRKGVSYPATLITTSDHDDRVVPSHSFKFAAALQAAQGGNAPVLIRIQTTGGHGGGTLTSMQIREIADKYAFLAKELEMQVPDWR